MDGVGFIHQDSKKMITNNKIHVNGKTLEGYTFESVLTQPKSTMIFVPGVSGHVRDYQAFLTDLATDRRIITYNLRGHGNSQGPFDPNACADDLEQLLDRQDAPVALIGHSLGAGLVASAINHPNAASAYLLSPFLDKRFVHGIQGTIMSFLMRMRNNGMTASIDTALKTHGGMLGLHFNNEEPIGEMGQAFAFEGYQPTEKRVSWIVPNKDALLGTIWSKRAHQKTLELLRTLYPQGHDESTLATGTNHCLNLGFSDYEPFCRNEVGKRYANILHTVRGSE
jgi:pimeloyl-ACP methyl ester carboxylesterase